MKVQNAILVEPYKTLDQALCNGSRDVSPQDLALRGTTCMPHSTQNCRQNEFSKDKYGLLLVEGNYIPSFSRPKYTT